MPESLPHQSRREPPPHSSPITGKKDERLPRRLVLVGRIGAAHGVRGEVRIKSYTSEPAAIAAYGPLTDADGTRAFVFEALRPVRDGLFVARFTGVGDRRTAESLASTGLYASREQLGPLGAEEFLYADLVGLRAETRQGANLGTVVAVQNFGAGDILEIASPQGETLLVVFTHTNVPAVDLANGRLVVELPREVQGDRSEGQTAQQATRHPPTHGSGCNRFFSRSRSRRRS